MDACFLQFSLNFSPHINFKIKNITKKIILKLKEQRRNEFFFIKTRRTPELLFRIKRLIKRTNMVLLEGVPLLDLTL
jgi:hypothetical protein